MEMRATNKGKKESKYPKIPGPQPLISLENPLADYKKLMSEYVRMDEYIEDDVIKRNYTKIADSTEKCIWKLLFAEENSTTENEEKATALLKAHRFDSAFYSPWEYNDWIIKVRNELLKREKFDYWRNAIVKYELGPCWSRDSDLFVDTGDNAPEDFYKHAGCIAPFSEEAIMNEMMAEAQTAMDAETIETETTETGKQDSSSLNESLNADSNTISVEASEDVIPTEDDNQSDCFKLIISLETPLDDYKSLILNKIQLDNSLAEEELVEVYRVIAEKGREIIWDLLFLQTPLTNENQVKAAELLKEVKSDACSYGPLEYNNWIVSVRDELLRLNMIDFWRDQIVQLELGPCWARDCDWFDDMEDYEILDFYNHADCEAPFKLEMSS